MEEGGKQQQGQEEAEEKEEVLGNEEEEEKDVAAATNTLLYVLPTPPFPLELKTKHTVPALAVSQQNPSASSSFSYIKLDFSCSPPICNLCLYI